MCSSLQTGNGGKGWGKRGQNSPGQATQATMPFQGRMSPVGRLDPAFPGVMLEAAAFPDLCQPPEKGAHSWEALSAIHLGKRQVLSSDIIENRQPSF